MALFSSRFAHDPRLQKASENNPPMKPGERGESVATVQRALIDLGYDMPITTANGTKLADGIFGDETLRVVRAFQMKNGLDADGIVGRLTLAELERQTLALFLEQKAMATGKSVLFADTFHRTLRATVR